MAKKNIPYDQKYYDPEIECMPRPELEAMQLERLQEMVRYAYDNTVYYKRSFDVAGVKPEDIKTLKDLEKFPFIDMKTERETQHVGSFFGEMCSVPEEDVIFMATSSGSTGVPTVSPFTQEDFDLWQDTEARLFWQAGMRPTDRYVHGLNFALYVGELVYTTLMKKARPMIRFRTGDIGYFSTEKCECGRTLGRIHITGRKDEMFIVGAVNVFPSDVEYVVRAEKGLTGEYLIRVYDENFSTRYEVSVERAQGSDEPFDAVAARVTAALKAHTGVKPARVIVYDAGKLGTSSEHKASRFIDERGSAK